MKVLCVLVLALVCVWVEARGAGRAFPVNGENYAIKEFQKINRGIEWDSTNFLVDMSGEFANCDAIGRNGFTDVNELTQDGSRIGGYIDDASGGKSDVNSVNSYIAQIIDGWTRNRDSDIYQQIVKASTFGCSIRPACSGRASVSCLFAPEYRGDSNDIKGKQDALAFTEDQYKVAETKTGRSWDNDHFLENLSGFETTCSMLTVRTWSFPYATVEADKRKMRITGLYGKARNTGETEPAMVEVLTGMKKVNAKKVGCSIIPDCVVGNEMWVVVGCIFQE